MVFFDFSNAIADLKKISVADLHRNLFRLTSGRKRKRLSNRWRRKSVTMVAVELRWRIVLRGTLGLPGLKDDKNERKKWENNKR